uniref:Uncharacterized protein n=1 Tax=Salarias fasciatus TaxID=181472 RepID=A0A672IWU2_SALFA
NEIGIPLTAPNDTSRYGRSVGKWTNGEAALLSRLISLIPLPRMFSSKHLPSTDTSHHRPADLKNMKKKLQSEKF